MSSVEVKVSESDLEKLLEFRKAQQTLKCWWAIAEHDGEPIIASATSAEIEFATTSKYLNVQGDIEVIARITRPLGIWAQSDFVIWEWAHLLKEPNAAPKKDFKEDSYMDTNRFANARQLAHMKRLCAEQYGYQLIEEVNTENPTIRNILGIKNLTLVATIPRAPPVPTISHDHLMPNDGKQYAMVAGVQGKGYRKWALPA